jgi:hypothetical protein
MVPLAIAFSATLPQDVFAQISIDQIPETAIAQRLPDPPPNPPPNDTRPGVDSIPLMIYRAIR